jgi:hypothetical protein
MRLSEAIRLGTLMTSQAFRAVFRGDGACAWGAALLAVGAASEWTVRSAGLGRWPWAFAMSVNCPSCGRSRLVCEVIAHLNDDHRWTRERIGAWVAELEPEDRQAPEDAPNPRSQAVTRTIAANGSGDRVICRQVGADLAGTTRIQGVGSCDETNRRTI